MVGGGLWTFLHIIPTIFNYPLTTEINREDLVLVEFGVCIIVHMPIGLTGSSQGYFNEVSFLSTGKLLWKRSLLSCWWFRQCYYNIDRTVNKYHASIYIFVRLVYLLQTRLKDTFAFNLEIIQSVFFKLG